MNIHEYQAKALLAQFGVPVLPGYACLEQDDVRTVAERLDSPVIVVKSQIHAGGRGAGHFQHNPQGKGGVRIASSVGEAVDHASDMLGKVLVTKQTGERGKRVQRLYLEAGCDIRRELYLSLLVDRACSRVMVMASAEGGMDIEELAETAPEKIVKLAIDPATGISGFHCRNLAFALGFSGAAFKSFQSFLPSLYRAFVELDASLLEINPLVEDQDGRIVALDAKLAFDDNALFRHEEIQALRDESEEDKTEREAERHQLNYVRLDGSIGCMVNGAGLAMATMDIIKLYGGLPANFLDVGGGVTLERVKSAFEIILKDQNVKGVLVNIFGGIVRCDVIAEGIVQVAEQLAVSVPLVVRLDGTNAEEGRAVIEQSKLKAIAASDLNDAASKIVSACG